MSDPQSQNGYVYVRNLPTVLRDPAGVGYGHPEESCGSDGCFVCNPDGGCSSKSIFCSECIGNTVKPSTYPEPTERVTPGSAPEIVDTTTPGVQADTSTTAVDTNPTTGTGTGTEPIPSEPAATGSQAQSTADSWSKATFDSPEESLDYHYRTHVVKEGLTETRESYTQHALNFRDVLWDRGSEWQLRDGTMGWKIDTNWGPGGIYTLLGKIVSYWYF